MRVINAAVVAAALFLGGCAQAGNESTGTPCERFTETQTRFSPSHGSAAPEAKEMRRAMQRKREGNPLPEEERQKIWASYYEAQATTYRDIAADTTDQKLHDALIAMSDDHQQAADTFGIPEQKGLADVLRSCDIGTDETADTPSTGG